MIHGPAYRIDTARLSLRCFAPDDAPEFRALLDRNDDYLRPWIPWMKHEPMSFADTVRRLRGFRAEFDRDENFRYAVRDAAGALIGSAGLFTRAGKGALETGYLIDRAAAGQGYASEMTAALLRVAFEIHGVARVEIVCSPRNFPSNAIARKLGFHAEPQPRSAENSEGEVEDCTVWILSVSEYLALAPLPTIRAWDCLGAQLLPQAEMTTA